MTPLLSEKLKTLGFTVPIPAGPFGAYVPVKRVGNLLFVSGQLPMKEGTLVAKGQVPSSCDIEKAKLAARQCVINALGAIQAVEGRLITFEAFCGWGRL